jgi:muconolactone delta-isomerase
MKYIVFREFDPEHVEQVRARGREWMRELSEHPAKYLRPMRLHDGTIAAFSMIGQYKAFSLVEADTEEQLQNTVSFWTPLLKFQFIPIQQSAIVKQD